MLLREQRDIHSVTYQSWLTNSPVPVRLSHPLFGVPLGVGSRGVWLLCAEFPDDRSAAGGPVSDSGGLPTPSERRNFFAAD